MNFSNKIKFFKEEKEIFSRDAVLLVACWPRERRTASSIQTVVMVCAQQQGENFMGFGRAFRCMRKGLKSCAPSLPPVCTALPAPQNASGEALVISSSSVVKERKIGSGNRGLLNN